MFFFLVCGGKDETSFSALPYQTSHFTFNVNKLAPKGKQCPQEHILKDRAINKETGPVS